MGLFGSNSGSARAVELQEQMVDEWSKLAPPTINDLYYDIPEFGGAVPYDPVLNKNYENLRGTNLTGVDVDPRILQDQATARQSLTDFVQGEGLTDIDKAAINSLVNQQETASRGARDALTQEFEQRMGGVAGSGLEAVMKAIANQEAATKGSQQGSDLASIALSRKLDAASRLGDMAGEQRGQDFSEQSKVALAQDLIDQFNTQGRNRTNEANLAAQNAALLYGTQQQQRLQDLNTGVRQDQEAMNPELARQLYNDEILKMQGMGNASVNAGNANKNMDAAKNAQSGAILGTIGSVVGGIYGGPAGAAVGGKVGGAIGSGGGDTVGGNQMSGYATGGTSAGTNYGNYQSAIQPGSDSYWSGGGSTFGGDTGYTSTLPASQSYNYESAIQPGEGSFWSDARLKENIEPVGDQEAEEILRGLSPYKYNYKDRSMGEGEKVGPMAQELEQTAPGMVEDTPDGKKINYDLNTFAALLGHMNDKINRMS